MAVIYAFNGYRAACLLKKFSQQADGVARECHDLDDKLSHVSDGMSSLKDSQRAFGAALKRHQQTLEQSLKFCRICVLACELATPERMIRTRDQLRRHLTKH